MTSLIMKECVKEKVKIKERDWINLVDTNKIQSESKRFERSKIKLKIRVSFRGSKGIKRKRRKALMKLKCDKSQSKMTCEV